MSSAVDPRAASRTVLELVATLMEQSFSVLGEGVIMGTMPPYLERFGRANAVYMARNFVDCDAASGAVSALTPMNYVSQVTGTDYEMPVATRGHAVKRLKQCEFLDAFQARGDFPKAMICMLHRAAYQGSVNGLLDAPAYDVEVRSRILFGDAHCDFAVDSRDGRGDAADPGGSGRELPDEEELQQLSYGFYTFILTSFVDYLTTHLPQERVEAMLRDAAAKVGVKVQELMEGAGLLPKDAAGAAHAMLRLGGRRFDEQDPLRVTYCPQAEHILATTAGADPETAKTVRENACRLCKYLVQGTTSQVAPGALVTRTTALTLGDDDCLFGIQEPDDG